MSVFDKDLVPVFPEFGSIESLPPSFIPLYTILYQALNSTLIRVSDFGGNSVSTSDLTLLSKNGLST